MTRKIKILRVMNRLEQKVSDADENVAFAFLLQKTPQLLPLQNYLVAVTTMDIHCFSNLARCHSQMDDLWRLVFECHAHWLEHDKNSPQDYGMWIVHCGNCNDFHDNDNGWQYIQNATRNDAGRFSTAAFRHNGICCPLHSTTLRKVLAPGCASGPKKHNGIFIEYLIHISFFDIISNIENYDNWLHWIIAQ